MFIKVTLVRLDDKDKEILMPSLVNTEDIKKFGLDSSGKVSIMYKTYNEIGEEEDVIQEDMKTIGSRLTISKMYVPDAVPSIGPTNVIPR